MKTDDLLGHIGVEMAADGLTTGFWATGAPVPQPAGRGTFVPTNPLAPANASAAEIAAALDRRYGAGAGAQVGTGGSHGGRDLTPLYKLRGWDLPVARADQEDMTMVEGAIDWADRKVKEAEATLAAGGSGGSTSTPVVTTPAGAHAIVAGLAQDLNAALAKVNTALGKAGVK